MYIKRHTQNRYSRIICNSQQLKTQMPINRRMEKYCGILIQWDTIQQ